MIHLNIDIIKVRKKKIIMKNVRKKEKSIKIKVIDLI
jgi:hypothetical protein